MFFFTFRYLWFFYCVWEKIKIGLHYISLYLRSCFLFSFGLNIQLFFCSKRAKRIQSLICIIDTRFPLSFAFEKSHCFTGFWNGRRTEGRFLSVSLSFIRTSERKWEKWQRKWVGRKTDTTKMRSKSWGKKKKKKKGKKEEFLVLAFSMFSHLPPQKKYIYRYYKKKKMHCGF